VSDEGTGHPGQPGRPNRFYFDDLADESEIDADALRPEPANELVDTGPIQVIRDPIPGSVGGQQLYFDDLADAPAAEAYDELPPDDAAELLDDDEPPRRGLLAGATGAAGRPRPTGAVLAVIAVLALIGVIAAVGGQGHGHKNKHPAVAADTTRSSATTAPPRPSATTASPPRGEHPTAPPVSHRSSHHSTATPADVPLTVLNNTIQHGLARTAAQTFSTRGWQIGPVGNYTGELAQTTVYYDPANPTQHRAAETLAAQFPQVSQVQPRFASLPGNGLTVVLAPDWRG